MTLGEMTVNQIVEMCYNTKYCSECELRQWCNDMLQTVPTDWEVKKHTKTWLGPIMAEVLKDDQRA